MDQSRAM